MAIKQHGIGNDISLLKDCLEDYIKSEDNPDGIFNSVLTASDEDYDYVNCGCGSPGGMSYGCLSFRRAKTNLAWSVILVYNDGNSEETVSLNASAASSGATLANEIDFAYGTRNGLIIHFTYDKVDGDPNLFNTVLIAKSMDQYPIIVVGYLTGDPTNNGLTHGTAKVVHYPDSASLTFSMPQFTTAMQTSAVPFASYGNISLLSYTPHAYWMPVSNSYGVGFSRMAFGMISCVTNGYWFIDDEEGED